MKWIQFSHLDFSFIPSVVLGKFEFLFSSSEWMKICSRGQNWSNCIRCRENAAGYWIIQKIHASNEQIHENNASESSSNWRNRKRKSAISSIYHFLARTTNTCGTSPRNYSIKREWVSRRCDRMFLIRSFSPLDSDVRLSVDERTTTSEELSTDSKSNNDQSYK